MTTPSPSPIVAVSAFGKRKINLSAVFAGQNVGVKQADERILLVTFMHCDLGFSMTRHVSVPFVPAGSAKGSRGYAGVCFSVAKQRL